MDNLSYLDICLIALEIIILIAINYSIAIEVLRKRNTGNLVMKIDKNYKGFYWMIAFAFYFIVDMIRIGEVKNEDIVIFSLSSITILEACISNVIYSKKSNQIMENGMYLNYGFYKWDNIISYGWISSDTVKFKIETIFRIKVKYKLKLNVGEEQKQKINEVLQRYVRCNNQCYLEDKTI